MALFNVCDTQRGRKSPRARSGWPTVRLRTHKERTRTWTDHARWGLTLFFEVFERGVVGAGQFHDVPVGLQLEIQLRDPGLRERFWVFHGDI
jgi:hypothetical protein